MIEQLVIGSLKSLNVFPPKESNLQPVFHTSEKKEKKKKEKQSDYCSCSLGFLLSKQGSNTRP